MDEIGEQNIWGSGGIYASLTVRGLSDRFMLEAPTVLIARVGENKGAGHVWGARESLLVDR